MLPSELQWGGIGAAIAALIAGIFTWFTQRSRGRVEESIAAVAEWQKLTNNLSAANEALRAELKAEQAARIEERARMLREHEAEMKAQRTMNEGLLRIIAQKSASEVTLVGNLDRGSGSGGK